MRALCLYLRCCGVLSLAQSPEAGRVEGNTLLIDSPRPLDSAAITLGQYFGIAVSVEDPPYLYKDDVKAAAIAIPMGGRLEVPFAPREDGSPADIRELLQSLVDAANAKFPFAYRLDVDGASYTLIPSRTRDQSGQTVEITPLMDRRVTIPLDTRSIRETADLMAADLSAQTGWKVSCCQSFVAGIPWGMANVTFEAHNEPARSVLKRLIASDPQAIPSRYSWLQRCDPAPSLWCSINLRYGGR